MDKKLLDLLNLKRQQAYNNPFSIQKELDSFLEANGIYRTFNEDVFFNKIKGKLYLSDYTLSLYSKAILDNEKELLLHCLLHMGFDKCVLAKMVLDIFRFEKENTYLWHYADFLYSLKVYSFMNDYISLIKDKSYGQSREMLVLLIGESKSPLVIPHLLEAAHDEEILGHTLVALSNFSDPKIISLMKKHTNNKIKWIADTATNYVTNH